MARPTSRNEFKELCLRRLGKPVVEVNITDDQVEDRVDEALQYYWDYHFDGSEKVYYKHLVTQEDKDNKYFEVPENIIGVVRVFPIADPMVRSDDLFNIRYQIALNDLYSLTSVSMVPYYMVMQHLGVIQEILVGQQPIRYSRHKNRVYLDMNWDMVNNGEYLLIEAHEVIDPAVYTDVWADRWLQRYASALMKLQWGTNLTKFTGMSLPGGVQFNGERILSDAQQEVQKLEDEMITSYSMPVEDMIG